MCVCEACKYWLSPRTDGLGAAAAAAVATAAPSSSPAAMGMGACVRVYSYILLFSWWAWVYDLWANDWQPTLYFRIASIYMESRDVVLTSLLLQFFHFFCYSFAPFFRSRFNRVYFVCMCVCFFWRILVCFRTAAGTFKCAIGDIDDVDGTKHYLPNNNNKMTMMIMMMMATIFLRQFRFVSIQPPLAHLSASTDRLVSWSILSISHSRCSFFFFNRLPFCCSHSRYKEAACYEWCH